MTPRLPGLEVEPCDGCGDTGLANCGPPHECMDPMPCPCCRERAYFEWLADPYGLAREPAPPPRPNWWRTPERTGQLGLGLGFCA